MHPTSSLHILCSKRLILPCFIKHEILASAKLKMKKINRVRDRWVLLSLSGLCRSLLLREYFKPGQRSLVMSSLRGLCRSLLQREDFEPGQRSLVTLSLSGLYMSLLLREDYKPGQRSLVMSSLSGCAGLYY